MLDVTFRSVAVLGGYGVFGSRIVRSLARHSELDVIIAGRDAGTAQELVECLRPNPVRSLRVDVSCAANVASLLAQAPAVVVDTVGPFQGRDRSAVDERRWRNDSRYVDRGAANWATRSWSKDPKPKRHVQGERHDGQ